MEISSRSCLRPRCWTETYLPMLASSSTRLEDLSFLNICVMRDFLLFSLLDMATEFFAKDTPSAVEAWLKVSPPFALFAPSRVEQSFFLLMLSSEIDSLSKSNDHTDELSLFFWVSLNLQNGVKGLTLCQTRPRIHRNYQHFEAFRLSTFHYLKGGVVSDRKS
jgi:hypothetical protein